LWITYQALPNCGVTQARSDGRNTFRATDPNKPEKSISNYLSKPERRKTMSKQNEMMAKALKEYMQMRADDIAEVHEIMSIEDVKTKNARQDKYIEDTLNNVFARHMPELHEQEEYRGMDAETIYNKLKGETK